MNKVKLLFFSLLLFFHAFPLQAENAGARTSYVIYFDAFASTPRFESMKTLESIKNKAADDKNLMAVIEGHADDAETRKGGGTRPGTSGDLSRMRAEFVSNWLGTALGSAFSREVKSYGSSVAAERKAGFSGLFGNDSNNRRVEVKLYAKDSAGTASKVFVPEMEHTFNDVYEGESVIHNFVIRNRGTTPLSILDVKPG